MTIPYENQTDITKRKEVTQKPQTTGFSSYKPQTTENPAKSFSKNTVDKPKSIMYNDSKESTGLSNTYVPGTLLSQAWKDKNKDSMRYAGDSAKKSIDAGLKEAPDYMKDADEGTNFENVQSAVVKRQLANDSNNAELAKKATMEIIGHLSKENKEPYLKHAEPLQTYIDAKDEFDYKHKNYTTTEFLDPTPDERVRQQQQMLNEAGYTDKFGEKLKEDGILGGKTLHALDRYETDNKYESTTPKRVDYQLDYAVYYPERDAPRMLTDEELEQKYSDNNVQLLSSSKSRSNNYNQGRIYENKIRENAILNDKSERKIRKASNIISRNADAIKKAGQKYGVNPSIIATCIYSEQILNVNITDIVKDQMYWDNPSVGIGQVAIETAKTIENYGRIEPITYAGKREEWHANGCVLKDAWNVPGCIRPIVGTKEYAIYYRLNIEEQCVEYVAAYLQLIQDLWREKYPIIDGKSDILSTLYNIGEYGGKKGINSKPEPNHFGIVSKQNYYYMQYLLGVE